MAPGLTLTPEVVKQFTKTAKAVAATPWHLARASEWLKTICLNTPLDRPEYIKMKLSNFPDDIKELYTLEEKVTEDGCIYI